MCGIVGVIGEPHAPKRVCQGLHNLQHRGQESAGIVSYGDNLFYPRRGLGVVNDVFSDDDFGEGRLEGEIALGHVRYATNGEPSLRNAQPFVQNIAIAHNGEIANHYELRKRLMSDGVSFASQSDSEVILQSLNRVNGSIEDKVLQTTSILDPSYAFILLGENKLVGVRDGSGNRPLEIGKTPHGYALASETTAFQIMGAEPVRSVKPGEMVVFDKARLQDFASYELPKKYNEQECSFESIYFSHPISLRESGVTFGEIRRELGRQLFKEHVLDVDVICEVPDSGFDAAMGYAEASGIPYDRISYRSHYIGRTFITPVGEDRAGDVLKKHAIDPFRMKGKRVGLVDDSIVRGTNMRQLVNLFRTVGGAAEVHVLVRSPPYKYGSLLGINTHNERELIARQHETIEGIRDEIGADSLHYLSLEGLRGNKYLSDVGLCDYCFTGDSDIPVPELYQLQT